MSKRIKLLGIFLILGLLTSLVSITPLLSATSGTVDVLDSSGGDEITWTNPGDTLWITVADADLDVAGAYANETTDYLSANYAIPGGAVAGDTWAQRVKNFPILDRNDDSVVNFADVLVSVGGVSVWSVDAAGGLVTFIYASGSGSFDVTYDAASPNNTASDTVTGTHDGGDGAAILGDSGATLVTDDVLVGDVVTNVTDGSSCALTGVTETTATCTLTGGTDDDWDDGDVYSIFIDDALVHIKSQADSVGIAARLVETSASSGVFELSIAMCQAALCSVEDTQIEVLDEDVLTIEYADGDPTGIRTTTVIVESTAPAFANFAPEDGFATASNRPTFTGDVTDADSGVLQDDDTVESIRYVFRVRNEADTQTLVAAVVIDPADIGSVDAITGGFSTEQRLPSAMTHTDDVYLVQWWMTADDVAGNAGVSDEDPDTDDCVVATFDIDTGGSALGGCDPYVVRIDFENPALSSATTGNWWDSSQDEGSELQSGADAVNTSIEVVFDEDLDGDSVSLIDFDSDDVDITGVQWFSGKAESVFLTTDAMDSDDEPEIEVVGSVKDIAGNAMTSGAVDADDGITATLVLTITGTAASQPVTDETIIIRVAADETLTTTPALTVQKIIGNYALDADLNKTFSIVATNTWEAEFDVNTAGLYNVYVTGIDAGSVTQTAVGLAVGPIDLDDEDLVAFEVDTAVATPAFKPADAGETDNADVFLIVDFSDEALEYGLDVADAYTVTPADVVTSFDTHGTVTVTDAELDGVDVTLATRDDVVFLIRPGALALGEHTLEVTVEDASGNEADFEATFNVTEKAAYELPVSPGLNLVSLPGAPEVTAIDDVLGSADAIDLVLTYDAADPAGPWLIAQRNATTGLFEGTLADVDGQHAYWMRASTFVDVDVFIAEQGYDELPTTVPVVKGWNLIPVIDVDLPDAGSTVAAGTYLISIEWSVAWTFDPLSDSWVRIIAGDDLMIGNGYWVWATASGNIVP